MFIILAVGRFVLEEAKWFICGDMQVAEEYLKNGMDEQQEGWDGLYVEYLMKEQHSLTNEDARQQVMAWFQTLERYQ
ncbi:hypothetical protein HAX54_015610 [Datura stramonium]|uniref:Uncharacterized protein n=1 Tax=Datura stramonium TaxID=4076 RepID=A0ABS8RG38_DATST|nr:hypothetical protein [Datura stramonium]